ncbi:LIM2 [Mytilus edulis]|uniref:LIM2 n=1 Tax=Mytilus edulis TaxID=6550 RepID=A0A8S3T559_MYTED|nr:LIM2 [Mytilus edulis]
MTSTAVVFGTFIMLVCLVLDVIGIATDYWTVVSLAQLHAGLFKICSAGFCVTYTTYDGTFLNVHYLGTAGCSCVCAILLLVACLVGFCGCSREYSKPVVQNLGGLGMTAGIFGTIGFLWYYLYFFKGFFNNGVILFSSFGNPGWSFYLCAVASGLSLVMSITLIVVGCNMPTSNGAIMPQQPAVITMQNQQQLYPQPSAPPQQHMY